MSEDKKSVLVLCPHFEPAYKAGGVVRTLKNFIDMLKGNVEFSVVSSDRDLGDKSSFSNIKINEFMHADGFNTAYSKGYFWYVIFLCKVVFSRCKQFDYVYLNGMFSFKYSILPLVLFKIFYPSAKIICAIRGEASTFALEKSSFKKDYFLKFSKLIGLYKHVVFQATSNAEEIDFLTNFSFEFKSILLVQDPVSKPKSTLNKTKLSFEQEKSLKIAMIGRVSPVKNIDFALKVLMSLNSSVVLHIFGPIEDENYWHECLMLIDLLPDNVCVVYEGAVPPNTLADRLSDFDLLFHPSRGENFGHVIYEALSLGVPVLTSDKTPWENLEQSNIGWDIPLCAPDKYVKIIEHYAHLEPILRIEMRDSALKYAAGIYKNSSLNSNLSLFTW